MQLDSHIQKGLAHEFMTCGCKKGEVGVHEGCCVTPNKEIATIGKKWATPLSGFIAGAVVASIIMVPWLLILGKMASLRGNPFIGWSPITSPDMNNESEIPMSYRANIVKDTQENGDFRRVLFTGSKSQLVVMSIPPGGEAGEETHVRTEQTLFILSGTGEGALDDTTFPIGPGDVIVVTPDTKHNFRNTGAGALKLYTVYAPPNHIDGRVHHTKANADADTADEAVGE